MDRDAAMPEPRGAVEEANFIANMKELREAQGWSQGELAKRMRDAGWSGFHQTTISRIEKGERPVRLGEARGIADALGTLVGPMLLADEIGERWRELDEAVARLREIGNLIGVSVDDYLLQQAIVRDLVGRQPSLTDEVHPATREKRDQAVQYAKKQASLPYSYYIDLVQSRDADGWDDGSEA
jgi:transcriptional regulator with XRE-family HTH domain